MGVGYVIFVVFSGFFSCVLGEFFVLFLGGAGGFIFGRCVLVDVVEALKWRGRAIKGSKRWF